MNTLQSLSREKRDFSGDPVVKTSSSNAREFRFDPWLGELRSHMPWGQKKKQKTKHKTSSNIVRNSIMTVKTHPHQKKKKKKKEC